MNPNRLCVHRRIVPSIIALSGLGTLPAVGAVIVSNLAESNDSSYMVAVPSTVASFTTGATATTLNSATLRIAGQGFGDFTVTYRVSIYSNSGNAPGTELYALDPFIDTSGDVFTPFDHSFAAPNGSALAANTTYWLVATSDSGDQGVWYATNSDNQTSSAGWTIGNEAGFITSPTAISSVPQLAIDATPVPEGDWVGSAMAVGLAVGALGHRHLKCPTSRGK